MNELAAMLGECHGCLEDYLLGDDVAPAQIEADAQNKAILLKRKRLARYKGKKLEKFLTKHPELADELGKFTIGGAFKGIGKGLTAPLRVVGKVATGDFKGALKTAADPLGLSKTLRKAKHTVQDVKHAIAAPQHAVASLATNAGLVPSLQMKCSPCAGVSDAIVKKVVPEMQRVQKILDHMELSRKATSEHKKKRQQDKWRKEVIRLLKHIEECRCA